ncbi:PepSY-associated TM helix domain-containing protein [Gordonia soli]|uniref:PepSY domain-containing protein n=1 Tax=Gordonia soli NBRC 108243 TaxID=1223545 RepID=M0QRW8_9ACTN|nr:hypothetical protein GS4_35_00380 [Gordonia soli NBRC 108243]
MSLTQEPPIPPPTTAADSSPPTPSRPTRLGWQPLLRRLHFYAGILVAPFLVVAVVSGGLYAIAPTLEKLVYRAELHTDSYTTGPERPLSDQVRVAMATRPDLTVSAVRPAAEPGDTTRVLFDDPSLGPSERRAVFIDPVTTRPTGELVSYGGSGSLPMRTWISQLHRHLHLGEPGRIYSEMAASWLWVIALAGLAMWISRYRRRRSGGDARLATVNRKATGRARNLNWHGAVGVWIVVGLVFLSATGLTWSKYAGENIGELRQALSWTTPSVDTALGAAAPASDDGHSGHAGHGGSASAASDPDVIDTNVGRLDAVVAAARGIGVTDAAEVSIPADAETAFTVSETGEPFQFSANTVAVNGATGAVTGTSWFADWPLPAKLTDWGISLHMGLLFGLVNQIVLLLIAIGLLVLIVRGYVMWWQRRPRRGGRPVGRPPLRGALRHLPIPTVIAVVVVAGLIGWFVPLLGISLLGFLVVDAAIGASTRWRGARTP